MSVTYFPQSNSSVMSIDAITSPCYNNENTNVKSRQSSVSSTSTKNDFVHMSSVCDVKSPFWCDTTEKHDTDGFKTFGESLTTKASIAQSNTGISASPSFSSFSCSEPENDSIVSRSSTRQNSTSSWFQPLFINDHRHSRAQTNNSIFTDRSEDQFNSFDFFDGKQKSERSLNFGENLNYVYLENSNKNDSNRSSNRKSDALAIRRARNKLASAKYRAKKQALTHAMQDRIMQLATQVMTLRDELSQAKKSEIETKLKYERLLQYYQHNNMMINDNAAIKPLF